MTKNLFVRAGVKFWFPDDNLNLSFLRPIDTKHNVCVADVNRQLETATQVYMIKVKVIVA